MIKLRILLALPIAASLISASHATEQADEGARGRPNVSMVFDPTLVDQSVTSKNAENHLDNLAVALMEGREDLLAELDSKDNKMDKKEIEAAKNYAATMNNYEKAALKAALKERKNQYALKQVLQILQGKI